MLGTIYRSESGEVEVILEDGKVHTYGEMIEAYVAANKNGWSLN